MVRCGRLEKFGMRKGDEEEARGEFVVAKIDGDAIKGHAL